MSLASFQSLFTKNGCSKVQITESMAKYNFKNSLVFLSKIYTAPDLIPFLPDSILYDHSLSPVFYFFNNPLGFCFHNCYQAGNKK